MCERPYRETWTAIVRHSSHEESAACFEELLDDKPVLFPSIIGVLTIIVVVKSDLLLLHQGSDIGEICLDYLFRAFATVIVLAFEPEEKMGFKEEMEAREQLLPVTICNCW